MLYRSGPGLKFVLWVKREPLPKVVNLVEIVEGSDMRGTEFEFIFVNRSALAKDQTAGLSLCREVEESRNGFDLVNAGLADIYEIKGFVYYFDRRQMRTLEI